MVKSRSQRELAQALLREVGIMRLIELRKAGVTAAAMSRTKVWMGIAPKGWAPRRAGGPIRIVRFADSLPREGSETCRIDGVPFEVFAVAKTVADCFRHHGTILPQSPHRRRTGVADVL